MKYSFSTDNGKISFSVTSDNSKEIFDFADEVFSEDNKALVFNKISFSSKEISATYKE